MAKNELDEKLRENLQKNAKDFKTSWIAIGQSLYSVWRDKIYYAWGYEKFEDYLIKELGMKKALGMRLVKAYFFVEQQEPEYLQSHFSEGKEAAIIPSLDAIDVLRTARKHRDLTREDYINVRKQVFEKGTEAAQVKKCLTEIIKERVKLDPDEERDKRQEKSIKRVLSGLRSFKNEMEILKLIDPNVLENTKDLIELIEDKYGA